MKKLYNLKRFVSVFSIIFVFVFSISVNATDEEISTESSEETAMVMVSNITVDGGTFTTNFKPGNYIYSVYLKSFKESINVSVELNDSRFEYTINGNRLLDRNEDNIVIINVTDPEGEYDDEKYTLNIFFDTIGLTYLDVENGIFSPQFDKFHSTYYVILENNIDTFEAAGVNWTTVNKDAVVEVTCEDELNEDGTLPEGERTDYKLKVCEADGTSRTYTLKFYRKASTISSIDENALLASIKINGGAVEMPTFWQKKSFYDITVPSSVTELDIQAYPVNRNNITEVIGSTIMKEDEPIYITIVVTSDKYGTSSYYTLRCQYDTAMYTQKYTTLELIAYVATGIFAGLIVGILLAFTFKHKKYKNKSETLVSYTEVESERNESADEQSEISDEK